MENNKTQNKSPKKTPENKRRGNQREIWLSAGGIGVLFLCLMVYLGHFVATSEQDMINNSYNSRQQMELPWGYLLQRWGSAGGDHPERGGRRDQKLSL